MQTGNWIKKIVGNKKANSHKSKLSKTTSAHSKRKNFKWRRHTELGGSVEKQQAIGIPVKDAAAIKIQTAFRAHKARKLYSRLRGRARLEALVQSLSTERQVANTLKHLQSWCKIQNEIRARRLCMVTESRLKQKKLENQLKLEAKLHDFEVDWCGGADTMEAALARIHLREEAAVKRERAMAYAFSHQWRANSSQSLGSYEVGKGNWGWSWMERWIAARPWENRVQSLSNSPKKTKNKQGIKVRRNGSHSPKARVSSNPSARNGNKNTKPRRLSYPSSERIASRAETIRNEQTET